MGFPMIPAAASALAPAATTPLLDFIAKEHAPRLAAAWAAPHGAFFTLPTARRHAAAILMSRADVRTAKDLAHLAHAIERERDGDIALRLMRGPAPGGLIKALGRCGETLWTMAEYERFISLFVDEDTAVVFRHLPAISAGFSEHISLLPKPLRVAPIAKLLPDNRAAIEDLASAWTLALCLHGEAARPALAQRWARADTPVKLFDMAAEALHPVVFGALPHPPDFGAAFETVRDRKALEAVALEFRNCLRDFAGDLAVGRMLVFVQRDAFAPIVFALRADIAGWRLAEAKLKDNEDVSEDKLRLLVQTLQDAGVRTGESVNALRERLHNHVCPSCGPAHVPRRDSWRDRLALGTLWD